MLLQMLGRPLGRRLLVLGQKMLWRCYGQQVPRLPSHHDWPRVVLLLREQRNESQVEFAGALRCSPSTVSKWERGECVPSPKRRRELKAMGEAVGLPPAGWPDVSRQEQLFDVHLGAIAG